MGFDRIIILAMDRFVWLVLIIVTTNCMLRLVTAHDKVQLGPVDSIQSRLTDNGRNPELEKEKPTSVIVDQQTDSSNNNQPQQTTKPPNRIQFFDTIFNIPIVTLKAVNDLVQHIAYNYAGFPVNGPQVPTPQKRVDILRVGDTINKQ